MTKTATKTCVSRGSGTRSITPTVADRQRESREALDSAKARKADLIEQQEKVKTEQAIRNSWERGLATYSALDLITAKTEAERLKALIRAADRDVRLAERRLVPDDISLAEHAATLLGAAFTLPVEAHPVVPEFAYTEGAQPKLYVVQVGVAKPKADMTNGALEGALTVYMTRGDHHRELDARRVLDTLEATGWRFSMHHSEASLSTALPDGGYVDEFEVSVGVGFTALPVLPLGSLDTRSVVVTVAGAVLNRMQATDTRQGQSPRILRATEVGEATIVSDETDNGERHVVADCVFTIASKNIDPSSLIDLAGDAAPSLVGQYTSLGRISTASLQPGSEGFSVRIEAVSVSRVIESRGSRSTAAKDNAPRRPAVMFG